jgi:hypothetical protein
MKLVENDVNSNKFQDDEILGGFTQICYYGQGFPQGWHLITFCPATQAD